MDGKLISISLLLKGWLEEKFFCHFETNFVFFTKGKWGKYLCQMLY